MDTSSQYLPSEIIRNILTRIPVKSVIRFQCVCKQWKHLMKNPSFIFDHLQQSTHQNPLLLIDTNFTHNPFRWYLPLVNCSTMKIQGTHKLTFPNPPDSIVIVGSCNGLVCVELYGYMNPPLLYLWNPATKACRYVPSSTIKGGHFDECLTGFGFSPVVNDYKIVRVYFSYLVVRAEVFSLSDGSWKEIDVGSLERVRIYFEAVAFNGAIFWSGAVLEDEEDVDGVSVMVSFDLAKEVFTLIPMDDIRGDEVLAVCDNKFALLCDIWRRDESDLIDLWVLEDNACALGKKYSWTKICSSIPKPKESSTMTIWRNQIVFVSKDDEKQKSVLHLMDITTKEVENLVIPYRGSPAGVYNYVESLVSVGSNCI